MNLEINNTTCAEIIFNGHSLEKLYYGAHLVWEKNHDYSGEYFTTTSLGNNNTIVLVIPSGVTSSELNYIEWSKDKTTWNRTVIDSTEQAIEVPANENENIYWRGSGSRMATGNTTYSYFKGEASFDVSGNIMSLLYGSNFVGQTTLNTTYAFRALFSPPPAILSHNTVVHAHNLVLPATTLAFGCYASMFYGCNTLTQAPALPATTLASVCYSNMFYGCTSLTSTPTLPATTLADACYGSMFYGCTGLTSAPTLPATTLTTGCYGGMFYGCTGLTQAPVLNATTLAPTCYSEMFRGCTSLISAPELPATTLALSCYTSMFYGCTGLTSAPELPATTLANNCYQLMFYGCSSLNYIKCLATDISASNCLSNWVEGVAATGTFIKNTNTTWPTGTSGIPTGWTVQNI